MFNLELPTIRQIPVRNEPDFYGFSLLIARDLRLQSAPVSLVTTWKHGWNPDKSIDYPKQIAHNGTARHHHVVHNEWQLSFLKKHGYRHVEVAGAPFIYAPIPKVTRIPNSLLVMPAHTLKHMPIADNFEAFFERVVKMKKDFPNILVCLHQESVSPQILEVLARLNLDYVLGASGWDGHSLTRMRTIFSSFECMVTNTLGSHIPYFNYCGGRASVMGPFMKFTREMLSKHDWYRANPEIMERHLRWSDADGMKYYPFLYVDIREQQNHWEWAAKELGHSYKRTAKECAEILRWRFVRRFNAFPRHPRATIRSFLPWYRIPVDAAQS